MNPEQRSLVHLRSHLRRLLLIGLIAAVVSGCGGANPGVTPSNVTRIVVTSVLLTSDPNENIPEPDGTLQTALERLQKAHGFHFVYNFNSTKLVGDATGLTKNYHYILTTLDGKDTATSKIGEWLVLNDPNNQQQFSYVKQGNNWVQRVSAAADQTYTLVALTILSNAMSVVASPHNFTRVAADTIDGQPSTHYININATPSNSHEVWVSQTTGEVIQITETTQKSDSSTDLNQTSVFFSDVNQPITIEAPNN